MKRKRRLLFWLTPRKRVTKPGRVTLARIEQRDFERRIVEVKYRKGWGW